MYLEFIDYEDKEYTFNNDTEVNDEYSVVSSAYKALMNKPNASLKYSPGYKRVKKENGNGYRKTTALERFKKRYKADRFATKRDQVKKNQRERAKELKKEEIAKRPGFLARHGGTMAGGAVGGTLGAVTGNVLAKKYKTELATLRIKDSKTPEDLEKIKVLKRKIAAATVGGGAIGAVAGGLAGKKYLKSKK